MRKQHFIIGIAATSLPVSIYSQVFQETLLNLPAVGSGRDKILLRDLQPVAMEVDWGR